MINDIKKDAESRMKKSVEALHGNLNKIRTGRAHSSILDAVTVEYYGSQVPLNQVANINIEDARTLSVVPWEQSMVPKVEKAIMAADLGLNPSTAGNNIRVPMPMLTEETRKGYIKQAQGHRGQQPQADAQCQRWPGLRPAQRGEPGSAGRQPQGGTGREGELQQQVTGEQGAAGQRAAGKQELLHRGPPGGTSWR